MFGVSYVKIIAGAILIAAAVGAFLYVKSVFNERDDLLAEKAQLLTKIEQLGTKIAEQNTAIDNLKAESDARVAAAEKAVEQAKVKRNVANQQARIIYKEKPADPNDLCKSALILINNSINDPTLPIPKDTPKAPASALPADQKKALDLVNGVSK